MLFSQRIAWGELPYRDYVYHYGSVCAYMNYVIGSIFGFTLPVFRVLTIVLGLLIAIGLFLIAREIRNDWWAVLPATVYTGYGIRFQPLAPYATWYCLLFMCGACLAVIRYRRSHRQAWLIGAGALCGLAFATKHTLGAFYLLASLLALRGTDPCLEKGGAELLVDVVIPLGALISFTLYALLLKSLWANVLLFVPLIAMLAVIFGRRFAGLGVRSPGRPAGPHSAWAEVGVVGVVFLIVQLVAVVPYIRALGLAGVPEYYRALFDASTRFAALHLESLNLGWPVSTGESLAVCLYVAGLVILVRLGRTRSSRVTVLVGAWVLLALGGLAVSGAGPSSAVFQVWRSKLVAWWSQSCALLVPVACALTGLVVLFDRAKGMSGPQGCEDATIVLLSFCAAHFFVILPIVLPAYFNIAAPPALVLATLLLERFWNEHGCAIPARPWRATAFVWLLALPASFWIIAMKVALAGIAHQGACPLDCAAGAILVDEPFRHRFESTKAVVDRFAVPNAAIFVFPVPSFYVLSGRRPWYPVMHLAGGFLRPDEQRDLPAVLKTRHVDAIVSFDTRNPAIPDDIASLAPSLAQSFELVHRDGNSAVWHRRSDAAVSR